jgi:hypothetical protein
MGWSSLLNSEGLTKVWVLTHKADLTLLISDLTKVWVLLPLCSSLFSPNPLVIFQFLVI